MAIQIKLNSNSTPGVTPNDVVTIVTPQLGELFVNTADGLLWVRTANGTFKRIMGPPGGPGPSSGDGSPPASCFLSHAMVTMSDFTIKQISDVKIGDQIFGISQINTVMGLQRPILGDRKLIAINRTLFTSDEHLVWTNAGWASYNKNSYIESDYNQSHDIINKNGKIEKAYYYGISPNNVLDLDKTHKVRLLNDYTNIESIEYFEYPNDTQLYSLMLDGDRTMFVSGYCVSGWACEKHFKHYKDLI